MGLKDILQEVMVDNVFEDVPNRESITREMDGYLFNLNDNSQYNEETYGDEYLQSFHPSKLVDEKCLRRMVLQYFEADQVEGEYEINPQLRRVFDNGHKVHDRIQRYFQLYSRTPKAKFQLLGRWECRSCRRLVEEKKYIPEPIGCPKCGGKDFKYREWKISAPEVRINGKVDGILRFVQTGIYNVPDKLLEIKSANAFVYQKLKGIKPDHAVQFNIYLWALGLKSGIIVYENKNDQSWVDYELKSDPGRIKEILKNLRTVNAMMSRREVPPMTEDKVLCKKCSFRKSCKYFKIPVKWRG